MPAVTGYRMGPGMSHLSPKCLLVWGTHWSYLGSPIGCHSDLGNEVEREDGL